MKRTQTDKYKTLNNIANGIHAANRIHEIHNSSLKRGSEVSDRRESVSNLNEVLKVLADYSPDAHSSKIGSVLGKSSSYSNTYRDLKQHLNILQSRKRIDRELLMRTLEVIKPMVGSNKKSTIDKALKIHEILKS